MSHALRPPLEKQPEDESTDLPDITGLLQAAADGDRSALDDLFSTVYSELRRLAHSHRLRWSGNHTLNTTVMVHEAYLKLVNQQQVDWHSRAHFFGVAGKAMRHILVNYAERQQAAKRGGGAEVVPLDHVNPVAPEAAEEVLALHEALGRLGEFAERQSRVVECRFFGGLTVGETAETLGISPATVKRDWTLAIAWLRRELGDVLGPDAMGS
jgi:RNA polymerase sigma factor (TIGR02999 family)